jgi:hypothetical protein
MSQTPSGQKCFKFWVVTTTPHKRGSTAIECKAFNDLCDYCYAELSEGCYVEVVGQIDRHSKHHPLYVLVTNLVIQKPKTRRQVQIRTTDFLQAYQPAHVLKRLNQHAESKRKEEENND